MVPDKWVSANVLPRVRDLLKRKLKVGDTVHTALPEISFG